MPHMGGLQNDPRFCWLDMEEWKSRKLETTKMPPTPKLCRPPLQMHSLDSLVDCISLTNTCVHRSLWYGFAFCWAHSIEPETPSHPSFPVISKLEQTKRTLTATTKVFCSHLNLVQTLSQLISVQVAPKYSSGEPTTCRAEVAKPKRLRALPPARGCEKWSESSKNSRSRTILCKKRRRIWRRSTS